MKLDSAFKKMDLKPKQIRKPLSNKIYVTKNCLFCDKPFLSYSKDNQKLCSNECRLKNKSHLTTKRFNWVNDKKPRHVDRLLKLN